MEILALYLEDKNKKSIKELKKKKYACAHCGNTWIELTGLLVVKRKDIEDVYLRLSVESKNCQTCKFQPIDCPECGSKNVYEIEFFEVAENASCRFKDIKRVARQ